MVFVSNNSNPESVVNRNHLTRKYQDCKELPRVTDICIDEGFL